MPVVRYIISRSRALFALCVISLTTAMLLGSTHGHPPRITVTPVVWKTPEAKAHDIKLLNDTIRRNNERRWYDTVLWTQTVQRNELLLIASVAPTIVCIKHYESGDPNEHSHPGSGSGAEQFVPLTWEHYAGLAGYGQYPLAYMAPPFTQDYVTAFTLTHGGAHNWDPSFGNDPCTRRM